MPFSFVKKKKRKADAEIVGGDFIKRGVGDFTVELEKSNALHITSEISSFHSPNIVASNSTEQSISFEYIDNLQSIRSAYLRYMQSSVPSETDFVKVLGYSQSDGLKTISYFAKKFNTFVVKLILRIRRVGSRKHIKYCWIYF